MALAFADVKSVCQEAFFQLRQDASDLTAENWEAESPIEVAKCKLAIETAAGEVFDAYEWADSSLTVENVAAWPRKMRNALVYCLARELAVPIAGRTEDMKNLDALYRQKLREARINDLSQNIDSLSTRFVEPFASVDVGRSDGSGSQSSMVWMFTIPRRKFETVGFEISSIAVSSHPTYNTTGASDTVKLAVFAVPNATVEADPPTPMNERERTLLALSVNSVHWKTNSLLSWVFDKFSIPEDHYLECYLIMSDDDSATVERKIRENWTAYRQLQVGIRLTAVVEGDDAKYYRTFYQGGTAAHEGRSAAATYYVFTEGSASFYSISERVFRRVLPLVINSQETPLPYSIKPFADTVRETVRAAHAEVTYHLGVGSLNSLAESAVELLATSRLAPVLGVDANFAQLRLKEYEAKMAECRKIKLEEERKAITDPDMKEVLSRICPAFTTGTAPLPRALSEIVASIESLKESARQEVLIAHDWNFAKVVDRTGSYVRDCNEEHTDGYPYGTDYPGNALRLISVNGDGEHDIEWKIEEGEICASGPVRKVSYIRDVTDFKRWTPFAKRAYILRLAADAARSVMANAQDAARLEALYRDALESAKLRDTRESNTPKKAWGSNHYVEQMFRSRRTNPWD